MEDQGGVGLGIRVAARRRLLFVIPTLGCGGAERISALLANAFARRGMVVQIVRLDRGADPVFVNLEPEIKVHALGLLSGWQTIFRLPGALLKLRRLLRHSDCVISSVTGASVLSILSLVGSRVPAVIIDHSHPSYYTRRIIHRLARSLFYRRANRIVVLTEESGRALKHLGARVLVIPNPVEVDSIERQKGEALKLERISSVRIVAMGRLVPVKGFERLLTAFATVVAHHPAAELVIWGEGPMRTELESLSTRLGISARVSFPGVTRNPSLELAAADIFVLSSYTEGFPGVLCEAMACGTAAVSFACPAGPAEIIQHEKNGLLVPNGDVQALVGAMDRLIMDKELRARLGHEATRVVVEYSLDKIVARYTSLIDEVDCAG